MATEEILLATLTTDENGEATYTYTGQGNGVVQLLAKHGMIQSETYEVLDCIKYDKGDTANTIWTLGSNNNAQLDLVDNSYRKLSEITSGTDAWVYLKIDHSCILEFDVQVETTNYGRAFCQYGQSANATSRVNIQLPSEIRNGNWHHIKLALDDGVVVISSTEIISPITVNLSNYDSSMDMYFRFRTDTEITAINFKEFKYYPI